MIWMVVYKFYNQLVISHMKRHYSIRTETSPTVTVPSANFSEQFEVEDTQILGTDSIQRI